MPDARRDICRDPVQRLGIGSILVDAIVDRVNSLDELPVHLEPERLDFRIILSDLKVVGNDLLAKMPVRCESGHQSPLMDKGPTCIPDPLKRA